MVSDINIYTLLHFVPDKNEYFSYHSTFDQNTLHVCHQSFLGKHKRVLIIVYINGNIFPYYFFYNHNHSSDIAHRALMLFTDVRS